MSEKDIKPYLSKMKAADPDVVFFSGYYFSRTCNEAGKRVGIKVQFIGEEGADSPKTIEIAETQLKVS
jgi:branched-chain amino acid transport system substrate-binding protein